MKRLKLGILILVLGFLSACVQTPTLEPGGQLENAFVRGPTSVFINELHYDNAGTDAGEALEVAGPAGTDLMGWTLVRYNGLNGAVYTSPAATETLSGVLANDSDGYGFVTVDYPVNGLQNGSPDGVALVDSCDRVIQFLSYEGSFTAVDGPAVGLTSTDIGVAEGSVTAVGASLQLTGSGATYSDFSWSVPAVNTFGSVNTGQSFVGEPVPVEACDDGGGGTGAITLIHDVQGDGAASPLVGQTVTVEGVVVGDFQADDGDLLDTDLGGFFVQEEDADADGDPVTSEGIFVFAPDAADVKQGDLVTLTGTVAEFNGLTELTDVTGLDIKGPQALPIPTEVTLPFSSKDVLERYEGMYVRFPQELVISEYFNFDRFGEIVLALPLPENQDRVYQPTSYLDPDTQAALIDAAQQALPLRRITLDDGRSSQNPFPARHPNGAAFSADNLFRGGDVLADTLGVLDDRFGGYRIQPSAGADYRQRNPRPAAPEAVGGSLRAASFNMLNYFTTLDDGAAQCGPNGGLDCRGANSAAEFARQRAKIIAALSSLDADIFGLLELENNAGASLQNLVDGLNAALGADTYRFIETGTIGTDAIKVGLLYKPSKVVPLGEFAILDASVDPRFIDTKNRPSLAQSFIDKATGGALTVVVNHFKSKGSPCDEDGADDGQGNCNETRAAAAAALVDWLATDPTGAHDADVLLLGDLNSYDEEDPIDALKAGSDDLLGTSDDYADQVERFKGEFAYSYLFDGQLGYLDYALANLALSPQVTGTTEWHINADEPDIWDYNLDYNDPSYYQANPYRSSDHEPILVGLELSPNPGVVLATLRASVNDSLAAGSLNGGQANALLKKLEQVQKSLDKGKTKTALNQLGAFENQLGNFAADGTLSAAQAERLLSLVQALRSALD